MHKHIFWISSYPKSGNTLIRAILTGLFFSDDGKVNFKDKRNIGLFETTRRLNFIKSINKKDFYNLNFLFIPVDRNIECFNVYNLKPKKDIFYAMSHGVNRGVLKRGKTDGREEFLDTLIKKNPTIKFDVYGLNGRQPVWAESFFNIISKFY